MKNADEINVRETHPNLYWMLMSIALVSIALALNFFFLRPTFDIYGVPNEVWASIFLAISIARIVTLNFYRRLRFVRATMLVSCVYMAFLAVGTSQPFWQGEANLQFGLPVWEGKASLQLPIVYAGLSAVQFFMMREPFINPETLN